ncbi:hypothetical protein JW964_06980 [candidate division KSB1 bacterium]|nr:hypothetical protein [candidate division KSB1 bacterium]
MEPRIYLRIQVSESFNLEEARIAVISWLLAKKLNATLVSNIHDLDVANYSKKQEKKFFQNLEWLGLDTTEGPNLISKLGSYRQSQRFEIYFSTLTKLLQLQKIFLCPVPQKNEQIWGTNSIIDALKSDAFLLQAPEEWRDSKELTAGVYLKPDDSLKWEADQFGEKIQFEGLKNKPILLMYADGTPTDIFAMAIDLMNLSITHLVRRKCELLRTLEENLIFRALNCKYPEVTFLSMGGNGFYPDSREKDVPRTIESLRLQGYLPYAILKFFCCADNLVEIEDSSTLIRKLVNKFDLQQLIKNDNQLNIAFLDQLNSCYLHFLKTDFLADLALPYFRKAKVPIENREKYLKVIGILKDHVSNISNLVENATIFLNRTPLMYSTEARTILRKESSQKVLWSFLRKLKSVEQMNASVFFQTMNHIQTETGIMGRELWMPIRIVLTGKDNNFDLASVAELLGKELCIKRVNAIIGGYW